MAWGSLMRQLYMFLKILYLSQSFDTSYKNYFSSMMWKKMHEKSSMLSYNYVTDDSTKPLEKGDLNALSLLVFS